MELERPTEPSCNTKSTDIQEIVDALVIYWKGRQLTYNDRIYTINKKREDLYENIVTGQPHI